MPLVEKRYAEALLDLALKGNRIEEFRGGLEFVLGVYEENPDLRHLLLNLAADNRAKKETIRKIFEGRVDTEVVNFLMLLVDKGKMENLPGICREYNRLADIRLNILNMEIFSAMPLESSQVEELKEIYRNMYNASSVKADVRIDKGLVGGVKVKIGGRIVDSSVKSRLEDLKKAIVNS